MFGRLLHDPNLWHLNRRSVSGATGIGLFLAFMPMPFQMVPAAALAIILRVNLPMAVAAVWISNPLTMGPMLYFQYRLGKLMMGERVSAATFEPTLEWYWTELVNVWQPLVLGSVVCGSVSALAGYGLVHFIWRVNIRRHLRIRKDKRAERARIKQEQSEQQHQEQKQEEI